MHSVSNSRAQALTICHRDRAPPACTWLTALTEAEKSHADVRRTPPPRASSEQEASTAGLSGASSELPKRKQVPYKGIAVLIVVLNSLNSFGIIWDF